MEELDNIVLESLTRYFTVLESLGYTSESNTNKIILLQFIQEFLQEYQGYITELDYTVIELILLCLAGTSCLIPFKQYQQISMPVTGYVYSIPIRVSEGLNGSHVRLSDLLNALRLVNL